MKINVEFIILCVEFIISSNLDNSDLVSILFYPDLVFWGIFLRHLLEKIT